MNDPRLDVLVIGAGMYVGGRGAGADGTVLPTLMQAQSQGLIGDILVAATSRQSIDTLQIKLDELNSRMGTQVKIKGYPSGNKPDPLAYREALADINHPACAIIVTPDHTHASIGADVIRAGVHPLVVKPLTPTVQEAQDLIKLAEEHNVYGAVEFHKRFDESNILLHQAIADGRLGDLRYITVEYSQRRLIRSVFESWLDRTNIFQYLGVHYVDLIYFLTRARPMRALAMGQPDDPGSGVTPGADSIQVLIEWEVPGSKDRFVSTIVTNWIDPDSTSAMSDQKITVVGAKGRYQIDQKHRGAQLVTQDGGIEDINPYFSQIYVGHDGRSGVHGYGPRCITQFLADASDFAAGRIQKGELTGKRPTFQDCLPSTAVVEAVNHSLSQHGEWVQIANTGTEAQQRAKTPAVGLGEGPAA